MHSAVVIPTPTATPIPFTPININPAVTTSDQCEEGGSEW